MKLLRSRSSKLPVICWKRNLGLLPRARALVPALALPITLVVPLVDVVPLVNAIQTPWNPFTCRAKMAFFETLAPKRRIA